MTHRLLLNPSSEASGNGAGAVEAKPTAPVTATPLPAPQQRDTISKQVEVNAGNKPVPDDLKGKTFDVELDNPIIAETFGQKPIEKAKDLKDGKVEVKSEVKSVTEVKPKQAEKKVVEAKPAAEQSREKPSTTIKAPTAGARDYTGYDEETVKAFKQMSDAAYQYTKKVVDERRELVKSKQDSYLQHPDAYTLAPEYQDLNNKAYYANAERNFWKEQLLNVRAGKEWFGLQGFDPKTGKPVPTEAQKPSDAIELELQNAMQRCDGVVQQLQQQGQQLVSQFKQRITNDVGAINAERSKRFEWVADPKKAEQTVAIPEVGDISIKQLRTDLVSMLPSQYRNSPVAELAADMFVGIQIYAQRIRELESQLETSNIKREEVLRAEPTATTTGAETASKASKGLTFDMEGFPS